MNRHLALLFLVLGLGVAACGGDTKDMRTIGAADGGEALPPGGDDGAMPAPIPVTPAPPPQPMPPLQPMPPPQPMPMPMPMPTMVGLQLMPAVLDFGSVAPGLRGSLDLTVTNVGDGTIDHVVIS